MTSDTTIAERDAREGRGECRSCGTPTPLRWRHGGTVIACERHGGVLAGAVLATP